MIRKFFAAALRRNTSPKYWPSACIGFERSAPGRVTWAAKSAGSGSSSGVRTAPPVAGGLAPQARGAGGRGGEQLRDRPALLREQLVRVIGGEPVFEGLQVH